MCEPLPSKFHDIGRVERTDKVAAERQQSQSKFDIFFFQRRAGSKSEKMDGIERKRVQFEKIYTRIYTVQLDRMCVFPLVMNGTRACIGGLFRRATTTFACRG